MNEEMNLGGVRIVSLFKMLVIGDSFEGELLFPFCSKNHTFSLQIIKVSLWSDPSPLLVCLYLLLPFFLLKYFGGKP